MSHDGIALASPCIGARVLHTSRRLVHLADSRLHLADSYLDLADSRLRDLTGSLLCLTDSRLYLADFSLDIADFPPNLADSRLHFAWSYPRCSIPPLVHVSPANPIQASGRQLGVRQSVRPPDPLRLILPTTYMYSSHW
jgi:hypothetical protein